MTYQDARAYAHDFAITLLKRGTMSKKQIAETAWALTYEIETEGEKTWKKWIYENAV